MANPKAWLPHFGETKSKRATLFGVGIVASLGLHFGLPASGWFHHVEAISNGPITVEFMPPPPIPLPESDKLNIATDDDTVDAPDDDEPVQDAPDDVAVKLPTPPDVTPPPAGQAPPTPQALEPLPVVADGPAPVPKTVAELMAQRDSRREQRLAQRRVRYEERRAKRSGGQKGGAPDSGEWKTGQPDSVYACTASERGAEIHVSKERPLTDWIAIMPTVLSGIHTRPEIGGYLGDAQQVVGRDRTAVRRLGFVEIALPNDVLQVDLDTPARGKLAIGRLDARCLVGFRYTANLFPFSVMRVPARLMVGNDSTPALVDITFFKDVSIEMHSVDGSILPFSTGRIKNGKAIAQNIEDHYQAVRFAKAVADVFGISFGNTQPAQTTVTNNKNKKPGDTTPPSAQQRPSPNAKNAKAR